MKLIQTIINIFNLRWNDKIFTNVYENYITFISFIKEVFKFMYVINITQKEYGQDLRFALWGANSTSYIACYIALILKNVDFYLIPPNMKPAMVSGIITNSNINILFTSVNVQEYDLINRVRGNPCYKTAFNVEGKTFVNNSPFKNYNHQDLETDLNVIGNYNANELEDIITHFHDFNVKNRNREIGVFSSGADSTYPKCMYFNNEEVYNAFMKLVDTDLLPNLKGKAVYSEINFAIAPVWCILWPLYSDARFVFSKIEASIVITNTNAFENHWYEVVKHIYQIRWFGKLLLETCFSWLFTLIARHRLKKDFNFGTRKDAIIILNAFLSPRIIHTIVGKLPIYTTYGVQETNQVIAINNYSSKKHKEQNCVGEPLNTITVGIKELNVQTGEGALVIASDHFANYLEISKGIYYDTNDHASIDISNGKTFLFVYGKLKYAIKNSPFNGSNYENLERILKNVPYFKEVFIFMTGEDCHILIKPNKEVIEANKMGLLDFKNFVKGYKATLNQEYGIDFIKSVTVLHDKFLKTHDGKIKKAVYFVANATNEDL